MGSCEAFPRLDPKRRPQRRHRWRQPLLSLREARIIIDAAVAFSRDMKLRMTVVVLDETGKRELCGPYGRRIVSSRAFRQGKGLCIGHASPAHRSGVGARQDAADRYFGIMNIYPGEVYLVGGGMPLSIDNRLVGAVGVAGLPQASTTKPGKRE